MKFLWHSKLVAFNMAALGTWYTSGVVIVRESILGPSGGHFMRGAKILWLPLQFS